MVTEYIVQKYIF